LFCADVLLRPMAVLASQPVVFKHVFQQMQGVEEATVTVDNGEETTVISKYDVSILAELLPALKDECDVVFERMNREVKLSHFCAFLLIFSSFLFVNSSRNGPKRRC